jgi:hypothetical protein
VLQQMKQTADSIHAPLIVVWIPVYFYPEINDLPARLAAVIKDAGILLVDMAPRFREMQREGAVIAIPGNGHMTPAAHQAVAAAVAKLLKEHKMLEARVFVEIFGLRCRCRGCALGRRRRALTADRIAKAIRA